MPAQVQSQVDLSNRLPTLANRHESKNSKKKIFFIFFHNLIKGFFHIIISFWEKKKNLLVIKFLDPSSCPLDII